MSGVPLLDLKAQYRTMSDAIERAVREVVESQQFVLGEGVRRFEDALARYVGTEHAVGCASGTDALILSLAALDIGDGDEVVTSPFSFFSTASCAYKVGARPRFADIDPETFNVDPAKIEAAITPRTKAIVPVHLFGTCADLDAIDAIAARASLPIVEDAAQALGAWHVSPTQGRRRAGALGTVGCFSFFPSKNLGGYGDGGAITTDDGALAERLRKIRVHGALRTYHHDEIGWNSRLDALQAAVLRVKLPYLDGWCEARARNAARYDSMFRESGLVESGRVRIPERQPGRPSIYNQYTVRVDDRDALREHLGSEDIGSSVYYPVPLHLQRCFAGLGYREGDFPIAERAAREVISLPVFPELTSDQQDRVVDAIVGFYRHRTGV